MVVSVERAKGFPALASRLEVEALRFIESTRVEAVLYVTPRSGSRQSDDPFPMVA